MSRAPDPGPLGTGRLTKLDEQVLAALSSSRGQRLDAIAKRVYRYPPLTGRGWKVPPEFVADVRSVLRGFEHLGRATSRGGWWRTL